ncbi:hypothetical protein ABPG74_011006 [Tetrahymena malaccensis]
MNPLDYIKEYVDFGEGLDFWTKYGLIAMNFIMIVIILVAKKFKGSKGDQSEEKNILFVIAHPDDESMFFLPTILEMKEQNYKLHLLSFSNGGFDGLGKIREKELEKCCRFLGFEKCEIIDDPQIQDGMDKNWPTETKMLTILQSYVEKHNIKGIFTFDDHGVSGHPNHKDVYRCVRNFKQQNTELTKGIKFFKLQSVNIIRKYIGAFDILFCIFSQITFVNCNPLKAWQAMSIHHSQFVYFRKLFVIFSRYAYINTLHPLE